MNTLWKSIQKLAESKYSLVLILLLSAALKVSLLLVRSDAVINNDGVRYIEAARLFARGEFAQGVAAYPMPLYPLVILLAQAVVPNWVLAARLVSLVSLVLVLIPLHLLTRDLFDRRAAFWACLAFALAPLPNRWTLFIIREPLFALFFIWAVHLSQRAFRSRRVIHLVVAASVSWCTTLVRLEGVVLFLVYLFSLAGLAVVRPAARKVALRNLLIWTAVPACLLAAGWWTRGADVFRVTRYGELAQSVQNLVQFKFLENYHHIYGQLEHMEETSTYSVGNQNFAEIARQFIALVYAVGLLQSLIRVLFVVNVVPFLVSLRRCCLQETHRLVLFLGMTYLLVMYCFLVQKDFMENRFLLAPALIFYPWIGAGFEEILAAARRRARAKAMQWLAVAVLVLSPMTITVQLYAKSDNVELKAGRWLAEQEYLKKARILTTDYRILFYAGRDVLLDRQGNDFHYQNRDDLHYGKIEEVGMQNHMDLLVISILRAKEQRLPEMKTYRELKRFVGHRKVVIVYSRSG
jgi:hypothetical protein